MNVSFDPRTGTWTRPVIGPIASTPTVWRAPEQVVPRQPSRAKPAVNAVDEWLVELERAHGPAPVETLEWAARVVDEWEASRGGRRKRKAG